MAKEDWKKIQRHRLANARLYVAKYAPYWANTLYGMVPVPVDCLTEQVGGPMALTAKMVLLYEPEWVDREDEKVIAFGLAHECMHKQLLFHTRVLAFKDPQLFSLAQDLFINPTLGAQVTAKGTPIWPVPEWVALPEKFGFPNGLSADKYYELLLKRHESGNQRKTPRFCSGACGGAAGSTAAQALEAQMDERYGRSTADVTRIVKETARQIRRASETAQGRGLFPASFIETIEGLDEVEKVRWEDQLCMTTRAAIGRAQSGGLDYSLSRPSRRSLLRGWPIPGLIKREFVVAIVIDSSGSMSTDRLKRACAETAGVLRQTGIEKAWLLIVDAKLQEPARWVTLDDLISLPVPGRGGTSFIPGVEAVDELEPRPDVTIYFTDGDGQAPEDPPENMQFIWGLINDHARGAPAEWGEAVHIEED